MTPAPEWSEIYAENNAEMLAYIGTRSGLESYRSASITWVITGIPAADANGVLWTRLTDEEADLQVPLLVERFRMQQLPGIWRMDATTQPADLGARLEALGCTPVPDYVRMAAPVLTVTRGMRNLPELTIQRVTSVDDLRFWMDVWSEVRGEPRNLREELYANLGLNRFEPLRLYLAWLGGRAVGVSQLFLGQRGAGIHHIAVREDYRGLGLGAALVQQPLLEARTLGYDVAVLTPNPDTVWLYEALGFERVEPAAVDYQLWP